MPKFGIHHIVMKDVRDKLSQNNAVSAQGTQARRVAAIMAGQPFASSLGAIGPDLLFWAPDYEISGSMKTLIPVVSGIYKKYDQLEKITETVEDAVDGTVDAAVAQLSTIPVIGPAIAGIRQWDLLLETIGEQYKLLAETLKNEIRVALFTKLLGLDGTGTNNGIARNLYQTLFQSKLQEGAEEMDWYWFEMLHYRRTGDFVKKLIALAEAPGGTDMMKAYAYGYATHYATDFLGHPYVNTISGAPYRISVQRHVVIENYMDQWKWVDRFNENIRNTLVDRSSQSRFDLPDELAGMIADALKDVYADEIHPLRYSGNSPGNVPSINELFNSSDALDTPNAGIPDENDIKLAYQAQRLMLEHLGKQKNVLKPAEPFPGADQLLATITASVSNFSAPSVNPNFPQAEDFLNWDSIIQSIQDTVEFVFGSIETIASVLGDILTDPASATQIADEVAKKAVMLVNYWIQLEMYKIYRMLNQVLALSGMSYPEPDEADLSNPVARRLITLEDAAADSASAYPLLRNPGQPHLDRRAYVDCNSAACNGTLIDVSTIDANNDRGVTASDRTFLRNNRAEQPVTQPSFYPLSANTTPDIFIADTPLNTTTLSAYAACTSPAATALLHAQRQQIGNAVDLSVFIIENALTTNTTLKNTIFCNWNLDGDRGYGHKCWDGVPMVVYTGEIRGAIENNSERKEELYAQNFKCWTNVTQDLSEPFRSVYGPAVYVNRKSFSNTYVTPLLLAQNAIPQDFYTPKLFPKPLRWEAIVPKHLQIVPGGRQKNYYFINGMATSRPSGLRSTKALQHVINQAMTDAKITGYDKALNVIHIRNLMNYTDHPTFNFGNISDIAESVVEGYCYSLKLNAAIDAKISPLPAFTDATLVAILALLQHADMQNEEITLCGHSQGAILIGCAILLHSQSSTRSAAYLKSKVKVLLMSPELTIGFRNKLRDTVEELLVYIMNVKDPNGADVLTEIASGEFPIFLPNQTQMNLVDSEVAALADLFSKPRLLDVTYYQELQNAFAATGTGISAWINLFSTIFQNPANMVPHNMPSQLLVIKEDIAKDLFRTDPGVLPVSGSGTIVSTRSSELSTDPPLDPTSVNVRKFFMS
jgi:hypothetical protein